MAEVVFTIVHQFISGIPKRRFGELYLATRHSKAVAFPANFEEAQVLRKSS